MKVAAVRSERPWALVVISNPRLQMIFVSQLSTTVCVWKCKPLTYQYTSCHVTSNTVTKLKITSGKKVFHSLKGEIHSDGRCQRAIVALEFSWVWREKKEVRDPFGLEVINEVHQGLNFNKKGIVFHRRDSGVPSNKLTHRHIEDEARINNQWPQSRRDRTEGAEDGKWPQNCEQ